jgi:AraC-like DNA-binding protein
MFSSRPIFPLQPYIESIWYCRRHVNAPENTLTLPFGRIELVINFSGTYEIKYPEMQFEKKDMWVSGQLTKPTITRIVGEHECIGIVFTSLGVNAFWKIEASQFTDKSISLDNIFGNEIIAVKSEIRELKSPEAKIHRIEQFFLKRVTFHNSLSTIKQALDIICSSEQKKKVTVSYLYKTLKISRNSLNKQFKRYIGVSASTYLQQKMFNSVIRDISKTPGERLIGVGYDYNFFDQAHFIKQFQTFAGMSPGQYLQFVKNNAIDNTFPNFITW